MTYAYTLSLLVLAASLGLSGCAKKESGTTRWMDPKKINQGPIVHDKLSEEQLARIARLQKTFAEIDPTSLEKWIEDFSRDQNPDREIAIWEGMAAPYEKFVAKRQLTLQGKKEAFQVVLLRSGASAEETIRRLNLHVLSASDAQEILASYQANPEPIRVYAK